MLAVEAVGDDLLEQDLVALAEGHRSRSRVTSPSTRTARPGPGNGCRQTIWLGQPEHLAERADLVLEQIAQRLDEFEAELLRQPADVVVQLDVRRGARVAVPALDDVGIERALGEELRAAHLAPRLRGRRR